MSENKSNTGKVSTPEQSGVTTLDGITLKSLKGATADTFKVAARTVREAKGEHDDIGGGIMFRAATLRSAASDLIGKGEDKVWQTQGAYAKSVGYKETDSTLLTRTARAVELGVKPATDEWTFVSQWATSARVGAILMDKEVTTLKALRAGLAPLRKELKDTGKIAAKSGETRGQGRVASENDNGGETPAPVVPVRVTPKDVDAMLANLRPSLSAFTPEEWSQARKYLLAEVSYQDNKREIPAKAKAAKATPATVAKVAKAPAKAEAKVAS